MGIFDRLFGKKKEDKVATSITPEQEQIIAQMNGEEEAKANVIVVEKPKELPKELSKEEVSHALRDAINSKLTEAEQRERDQIIGQMNANAETKAEELTQTQNELTQEQKPNEERNIIIPYTIKCERCGKEVPARHSINPKLIKRFCSLTCRTRQTAINTYNKMKDDPVYKAKRKAQFNSWLEKNRDHFNDLVRPNARKFMKKRYDERKAKCVCVSCGNEKEPERQNKTICLKCNATEKVYCKEHRLVIIAKHKCVNCYKQMPEDYHKKICAECLTKERETKTYIKATRLMAGKCVTCGELNPENTAYKTYKNCTKCRDMINEKQKRYNMICKTKRENKKSEALNENNLHQQ